MATLPPSHKALVLTSFDTPLALSQIPTPHPTPGSAVISVLSTGILPYASGLYNGSLKYPLTPPMTVGGSCIGRVAALAPDACVLRAGDLVLVDSFVHARDDSTGGTSMLLGTHAGISAGSQKLMGETWKDASFAEFVRVPLENVHMLNESVLCAEMGYGVHELAYSSRMLVPMGGLCELDVRPGERVAIAPATGAFGGAAVEVAVAMRATVVAAGRNADALARISQIGGGGRVHTVKLTGAVEDDVKSLTQFGAVDAYLDFSPSAAKNSTHITACLMALRNKGRACFMGGIQEAVEIPYGLLMFKSVRVSGKFMFERADVRRLIGMCEGGLVKLGKKAGLQVKVFGLWEWEEAFERAEKESGWGVQAVFEPWKGMEG